MQSKLEDVEKKSENPDRNLCPDHPEEDLRFYCVPCEVPICRDCKVVSHEGHPADLVSKVAKVMRETLIQLLEKTESEISTLKEKAENAGEKVEPKNELNNNQDNLNQIKNAANETKLELDKLVCDIESEIKLHDDDPNTEIIRDKIAKLVSLKEGILEALNNKTATVLSFKKLTEEENKLSDDTADDKPLTRAIVEENLLSELKPFLDEIVEDIQNFDVKRIASGQPYAEINDVLEEPDNWTLGVTDKVRSAAATLARIRNQPSQNLLAELSLPVILDAIFWILQLVFCLLPVIQAFPVVMLLYNIYPEVHPVITALAFGLFVESGILMVVGGSVLKPGTLLLAGVLTVLAFIPCLDHKTSFGTALIWTRDQGCIGLYCLFAARKCSSKVLGIVGEVCIAGCIVSSVLMLMETNVQLWFPGGKNGFIVSSLGILAIYLTVCWGKANVVQYGAQIAGYCILLASVLIVIDKNLADTDWKKKDESTIRDLENIHIYMHGRYNNYLNKDQWYQYQDLKKALTRFENSLYWTFERLVVCNVSIIVGMLVLMEREIVGMYQRLCELIRSADGAKGHKD